MNLLQFMENNHIKCTNPIICEIFCSCGHCHYVRQNDFSHTFKFFMAYSHECSKDINKDNKYNNHFKTAIVTNNNNLGE